MAGKGKREALGLLILLLILGAAIWSYFWWAHPPGAPLLSSPTGEYYSMQTDALLSGQLHIKIPPRPELLAQPDPYDPAQNQPYRMLDMSLYRGRYYFYFGVGPVLSLFIPWTLLTGTLLSETVAAPVFASVALVLGATLLLSMRNRYLPGVGLWAVCLCAAVLAWGTLMPLLFYGFMHTQVPMTCAYLWTLAALWGAYRACWTAESGRRWLLLAGFAIGMAVSCRPNFLFSSALLALPLAGRALARTTRTWRSTISDLAAASGPLIAIGIGLMIYNTLRFGSPAEFGMRYQLIGTRLLGTSVLSFANVAANLRDYLFYRPEYVRYFPFVLPRLEPLGVAWTFPFACLGALLPVLVLKRQGPGLAVRVLAACTAIVIAANLALLACYYVAWARYEIDFLVPLTLGACVVFLVTLAGWARSPSRRWLVSVVGITAGVFTIFSSLAFSSRMTLTGARFERIAAWANRPVHWWETWTSADRNVGAIELDLQFPRDKAGQVEPLVSTGVMEGDLLSVRYLNDHEIAFALARAGSGEVVSGPVRVNYDEPHRVTVLMGSLCPPRSHPAVRQLSPSEYTRATRSLVVTVDGDVVFGFSGLFHESYPDDVRVGRVGHLTNVSAAAFSGRLISHRRIGLVAAWLSGVTLTENGLVHLLIEAPAARAPQEPLVSTGVQGKGNLVFLQTLPGGMARIGLDTWGSGAIYSVPFPYPAGKHRLDLRMESLRPQPRRRGPFQVWFDGEAVISAEAEFFPSAPEEVYLGANALQASTAEASFSGSIRLLTPMPEALRKRIGHRRAGFSQFVVLAPNLSGRTEPFFATGKTGAGDLVSIVHVDEHHVRLAFDHWGVGGPMSALVRAEPGATQMVRFEFDPALPTGESVLSTVHVRVFWNEVEILNTPIPWFGFGDDAFGLGENHIGASACERTFAGEWLTVP